MMTNAKAVATPANPQVMPLQQYVKHGELGEAVPGSQFSQWFGDAVATYRDKSAKTPWWKPFKPHEPMPQGQEIGTYSWAGNKPQPLHIGAFWGNSLDGLEAVVGTREQAIAQAQAEFQHPMEEAEGFHSRWVYPMRSVVEARKGVFIVGGLQDSMNNGRDGLLFSNEFVAGNVPVTPKDVPGLQLTATDPAVAAALVDPNIDPLAFTPGHMTREASIHSPVRTDPPPTAG